MIGRLTLNNLFRNRWRSLLVVAGVAVATALLTCLICFIDGWMGGMIRGATSVEMGQIQVHTMDYVDRPTLYHHFARDPALEQALSAIREVVEIAPRCYAAGLLGHEEDSAVARIIGVDPEREARATVIATGIVQGRWLSPIPPAFPAPREAVLGQMFAEQLGVVPGAELVLFLQAADGSLGNELLSVVGIVRTGNNQVDRQSVYMHLADVQNIAALEGRLHELAIRIDEMSLAPDVADTVAALVNGSRQAQSEPLAVQPWQELAPEIAMMLDLMDRTVNLWLFIAYLIVGLGLFNAQRMSALERRREFGILMALGMKPRHLSRVILAETTLLAVLGALVGVAVGLGTSAYYAHYGLDLSAFSDRGTLNLMGISFTGRLHTVVSLKALWMPFISVVVMSLVCGVGPGIRSARLNITQAISGRS